MGKKPSIDSKANLKLDCIPRQLIGATASFLQQKDYIHLSKTNRSVFLGCNTPNLMQELNLLKIADYSSIDLALYSSVKTLKLKFSKFNEMKFPENESSVMNQLESITLDGENKNDIDIDPFMINNQLNVQNVTRLELCNFGLPLAGRRIDIDKLYRLLSKFPNIYDLSMYGVATNADVDSGKVCALCPGLTSLTLCLRPTNSTISLINAFGHQLRDITMDCALIEFDDDFSKVNFGNLNNLKIASPSSPIYNDILNTAVDLKSIKIIMLSGQNETNQLLIKCITTCKSLQSIKFIDYRKFNDKSLESVLTEIEKGLFETKSLKRKQMRLKIKIKCDATFKLSDFAFRFGNIIHWMRISVIKDFMLILHLSGLSNDVDRSQIRKELSTASTGTKVWSQSNVFFVSNKNCNLSHFGN